MAVTLRSCIAAARVLVCAARLRVAPVASAPVKRKRRRSCWRRTGRSTTSRSAARAIPRKSRRCAGAFSTISTAMPARAIRCNSAKSPSSIPARAKCPPAICARPPGKAATPSSFKFTSENFLDQNLVDSVDGHAEHGADATAINLAKPEHKALDIDAAVVFPTQHMVRVIEAARAGKSILDFPVFDGSETGEKVYDTLTVIGRKIAAGRAQARRRRGRRTEACRRRRAGRSRSAISKRQKRRKAAEQTPVYAISFELYENGISRALSLDYNDFVVTGKLTSLEIKEPKPCP